jgi:hypothetical protein
MIIIPENFKANNFTNSDKECKKAFELLRRFYDVIEKSHLNDHKMIPTYCDKFEIKKSLGEDVFNFLQSKDAYFIKNVIRRQKNFRQKNKNKFKNNLKDDKKK